MRKKRFLSLLAAIALACGMVGCQADTEQTVQENRQYEVHVDETTAPKNLDKEYFETKFEIKDWVPKDFCTILCHDAIISIPCKFSDIDEKFNKEIVESSEQSVYKLDSVELYLNGEYVGILCFPEQDYDIENDFLTYMNLETFDIKGLNEYSSKEDVQKKLGAGNNIDFEYADSYFVDNMMIIFSYLNNKTSLTVVIY